MIGIYSITNKKTGQMYIGQSINIEKRFKEHIRGDGCPNSRIDNAIQKYGKDYFKFEVIEEFNKNTRFLSDVLNDSEQYYIAAYNTFNNDFHYNLTIGGDGVGFGENHPRYGKHHLEESKKKMSEAQTGKHLSEETKKKMSQVKSGENNPMYGKYHSKETKKKMSEAQSGENNPQWKNYARIVKSGRSEQNKQRYAIKYQGKRIKRSIDPIKLQKWFSTNYPDEELRCEIK